MNEIESMIVIGGGKIVCARCTARAKRTGKQCKKPALKISVTKKCELHGGLSQGPTTSEGKAKSAATNYKTGKFTKIELDKADRNRALIRVLEDAIHLLEMVPAGTPRTRGRMPKMYIPLRSEDDILEGIISLKDGNKYAAGH
jgi:hypothetical protein